MSDFSDSAKTDIGEWLLVYDRLNPEIPRSNADDSENRATDINNKKEIEMCDFIEDVKVTDLGEWFAEDVSSSTEDSENRERQQA
jgi:hypothetical protein